LQHHFSSTSTSARHAPKSKKCSEILLPTSPLPPPPAAAAAAPPLSSSSQNLSVLSHQNRYFFSLNPSISLEPQNPSLITSHQ